MSATDEIVSATIGNIITTDGKYSTKTGIFIVENSMRPAHFLKKN